MINDHFLQNLAESIKNNFSAVAFLKPTRHCKSLFLIGLVWISLFFPIGWRFWLDYLPKIDYLSFLFTPADALFIGLFLFIPKTKTFFKAGLFFLPFILISFLNPPIMSGLFYLRFLIYPLVFIYLFSSFKTQISIVARYALYGLGGLSLIEFFWRNLLVQSGPFSFFVLNRQLFLSSLFFPHPNILAFVLTSLILTLVLYQTRPSATATYLTLAALAATGSFFAVLFLVIALFPIWLYRKNNWILYLIPLFLTLLLSDPTLALSRRLLWLPLTSFYSFFIGHGPAAALQVFAKISPIKSHPESYWYLQPPHNAWLIWFYDFGLFGLVWIVFWAGRLFFHSSLIKKAALAGLTLWGLFDHFFITTPTGQIFLSLVIALLLTAPPQKPASRNQPLEPVMHTPGVQQRCTPGVCKYLSFDTLLSY
ncbi:MAG: hypothetical protein GXP43_02110 [bacterium]|nr:hypothetical protein [bacterium]